MNRHDFFTLRAADEAPLAFKPEHEPRLERLRRRLGHLGGKRVVEPGCGAGPLTVRLAQWVGTQGHVLALDSCPAMLERCRAALAGHAQVQFLQAKVEEAELPARAWDLLLCFRLYPHLGCAADFLRRGRQWLAAAGELVIANLEGSAVLNQIHAGRAGVHGDIMPDGESLRLFLQQQGWRVAEVVDEPDDFFLRATLD